MTTWKCSEHAPQTWLTILEGLWVRAPLPTYISVLAANARSDPSSWWRPGWRVSSSVTEEEGQWCLRISPTFINITTHHCKHRERTTAKRAAWLVSEMCVRPGARSVTTCLHNILFIISREFRILRARPNGSDTEAWRKPAHAPRHSFCGIVAVHTNHSADWLTVSVHCFYMLPEQEKIFRGIKNTV